MMKRLEELGTSLDEWYKRQDKLTRFFANVALMAAFLCLGILGLIAVGLIVFWTIHAAIFTSLWFLVLLLMEITVPLAISFAFHQLEEENHDPQYR